MKIESPGERLSDAEFRLLATLRARHAAHDLDQFDHWSVETPDHGRVFIEIYRELPTDVRSEAAYTEIWPQQ